MAISKTNPLYHDAAAAAPPPPLKNSHAQASELELPPTFLFLAFSKLIIFMTH
jgi:hypothetical protein